jgi:hypothetical protein
MALGILLAAAKGLVAFFVLMFIGTNLIGMAVGGFVHPIHRHTSDDPFISKEVAKSRLSAYAASLFFSVLVGVYLVATWRYINPDAAVAAAMLMLSRVPDLLWEIRTGERITTAGRPKGVVHVVATALTWLALPLLWLSFY